MDDDTVLQALGAELEREDPALAALLSGPIEPVRRHLLAWTLLLVLPVVGLALVLAPRITLGVVAVLAVLAAPLVACWFGAFPDDGPAPRRS